jgi:phosphoadenosine phosphosulfate reductase
MSALVDQLDLDTLNAMFEAQHPSKIIDWTNRQFAGELVMTSSFGDQSAVLIHLASQVKPDIKIIFIDTGYLFPETHQFMEQLRRRLNLNVWTYRTRNDPIAWLHHAAEENPAWRKDIPACCAANKNEPMERAIKDIGPKAWLRGIRRGQGESRKNARFIEWSPRYGCYAVSPMLNWSTRDVHNYMKEYDLPYHPLVDKGFLSVGCNPLSCTRPVQLGEDARSGRWAGSDKLECGINSLDSANL